MFQEEDDKTVVGQMADDGAMGDDAGGEEKTEGQTDSE